MAYDFDLYVIGAGSGGVRAARFAAGFGAKVAVAESRYLGGTCVNVGCVPKKLLVYGAHFAEDFEQASGFGWSLGEANFDWATLIANKDREINRLNGIYRNLLVNSGVTLHEAHAKIVGPHEVEVNGERFTAKNILIATGGWPQIPQIPGTNMRSVPMRRSSSRSYLSVYWWLAVVTLQSSSPAFSMVLARTPRCCIAVICSCAVSMVRCASICRKN